MVGRWGEGVGYEKGLKLVGAGLWDGDGRRGAQGADLDRVFPAWGHGAAEHT